MAASSTGCHAAPGKVRSSCLAGAAGSRQELHCYTLGKSSGSWQQLCMGCNAWYWKADGM